MLYSSAQRKAQTDHCIVKQGQLGRFASMLTNRWEAAETHLARIILKLFYLLLRAISASKKQQTDLSNHCVDEIYRGRFFGLLNSQR